MKTKSVPVVITFILLFGQIACAHENTPLQFTNGQIVGLPAPFLPASFDIKAMTLSVAGKTLIIPEVLRKVLMRDVSSDPFDGSPQMEILPSTVEFSASWDKEFLEDDMPPYMVIIIRPKEVDCYFDLLIDLSNLELIDASLFVNHIGRVSIDLGKATQPKEIKEDNKSEMATPRKPSD